MKLITEDCCKNCHQILKSGDKIVHTKQRKVFHYECFQAKSRLYKFFHAIDMVSLILETPNEALKRDNQLNEILIEISNLKTAVASLKNDIDALKDGGAADEKTDLDKTLYQQRYPLHFSCSDTRMDLSNDQMPLNVSQSSIEALHISVAESVKSLREIQEYCKNNIPQYNINRETPQLKSIDFLLFGNNKISIDELLNAPVDRWDFTKLSVEESEKLVQVLREKASDCYKTLHQNDTMEQAKTF